MEKSIGVAWKIAKMTVTNGMWLVPFEMRHVFTLSHAIFWDPQECSGCVIKHTIVLRFLSAVISFVGSQTGIFKCFLLLK